jgi:hypothetical protein
MCLMQADLMGRDLEGMILYFNTLPNPRVYDPDVLLPTAWDIKVQALSLLHSDRLLGACAYPLHLHTRTDI